ncbi:unnamed protein product [Eretmochelys imbricata]
MFLSSKKPLFYWLAESHISLRSWGAGPSGFPRSPAWRTRCGKRTEGQRRLNAPRSDPGRWKLSFVKAIRALLLFALLASSLAVASLLVSVRPFARWRGSRFLVSATANFIAGLLVLISVVIFTAHVMLDSVNPQARASFEWAFFLAWTLSPLFVLSGCPPVLSPRVGPWGQPSQDLGETLAQGELEGGPGAEPLPLGQVTLVHWGLEGG